MANSVLKGKASAELGIRNPAIRFFHVLIKQLDNLPTIAERVHHGEVHEGDWHGIGSVKNWIITLDGKKEACKESIEAIDEENKTVTFNVFDGEISKKYKSLKAKVQVVDKEGGGGVVIYTFEYEKLNEDIAPPYPFLDYVNSLTKDIDAHLLKA